MTEIIPYSETLHYETLSSWWASHGWDAIPKHKLPPFGFVVSIDGVLTVASFAYLCNGGTGMAMIEWTVANPESKGRSVYKAVRTVLDFMKQQLKKMDYNVFMTSCRHKGLIKIFEKEGFSKTDEGITNLIFIA